MLRFVEEPSDRDAARTVSIRLAREASTLVESHSHHTGDKSISDEMSQNTRLELEQPLVFAAMHLQPSLTRGLDSEQQQARFVARRNRPPRQTNPIGMLNDYLAYLARKKRMKSL